MGSVRSINRFLCQDIASSRMAWGAFIVVLIVGLMVAMPGDTPAAAQVEPIAVLTLTGQVDSSGVPEGAETAYVDEFWSQKNSDPIPVVFGTPDARATWVEFQALGTYTVLWNVATGVDPDGADRIPFVHASRQLIVTVAPESERPPDAPPDVNFEGWSSPAISIAEASEPDDTLTIYEGDGLLP